MKHIKKIFLLTLLTLLIISCSKDDDPIVGCMDPDAVNYNAAAEISSDKCTYSIVGDWTAFVYTIDGSDILYAVEYFDIHVYDDSSYMIELKDNSGVVTYATGIGTYDSANNTLTLTPDGGGTPELWNLIYVDGDEIYMNHTDPTNRAHVTKWVQY